MKKLGINECSDNEVEVENNTSYETDICVYQQENTFDKQL